MNGWENNGKLPNGVYYTGINDPKNPPTPTLENLTKLSNCGSFQKYAGGSAGQSPIIHVIDALLSISHYSSTHTPSRYIYEMRNHMPKDYREYILKVEAMALKSLIGNEKEKYLFNECIDAMKRFRDEHLRIVSSYIIVPGNSVKNEEGVVRGTGGTDLLPFLKQMRDETKDASIS